MPTSLTVTVGQYSDKGRKPANQDFHGLCIPVEPQLTTKGIAAAVADGISSSEVSHLASESAVKSFLGDYYCTAETWSVRTSAQRVLEATNAWLHAQTRNSPHRYDKDRGYICTFSGLVLKSHTAHLFHVGDSRIARLRDGRLEVLTDAHRIVVSPEQSYLARALGFEAQLELDYRQVPITAGDVFVLSSDGVHEHVGADVIVATLRAAPDLDAAARRIADAALAQGSADNLTIQLIRVDTLPVQAAAEHLQQFAELPLPPLLDARMEFDGYRILRTLHGSSRSHLYLAEDIASGTRVALKLPSIDQREDKAYRERFMLEEWIARRLDSPHVLKPCPVTRQRSYLYVATEYIEGCTLAQWMRDHPAPDVETVRSIVEQIARGLLAFHRLEMLHQDLRPENIMIDTQGVVRIIDFGATHVNGLQETAANDTLAPILGTCQYTAPEYFLGEPGTSRSDLFSLGVIAYQMLCSRLPYGTDVSQARTRSAQKKLRYRSVLSDTREIPAWLDAALAKAVHPDPLRRYAELSEFTYDLRHPNAALLGQRPPPLIERNPLLFWQILCALQTVLLILLLARRSLL